MSKPYLPTYRDRHGKICTNGIWWVSYFVAGRRVRESANTTDYAEAKEFLKQRAGDSTKDRRNAGIFGKKVIFKALADLVVNDYVVNAKTSIKAMKVNLDKHLLPFFGKAKADAITEVAVDAYIRHRLGEEASNASVNRELATLKRAFSLGIKKRLIASKPNITMLVEDNVRQGFFLED